MISAKEPVARGRGNFTKKRSKPHSRKFLHFASLFLTNENMEKNESSLLVKAQGLLDTRSFLQDSPDF